MEAIIRGHAFADGNKRTGLLATATYLEINGYQSYFPLHVVRFSIKIADTKPEEGKEQQVTDELIQNISEWLKKYAAAKNDLNISIRIIRENVRETKELINMYETDPKQAQKILDNWLAIDIYEEYLLNRHDLIDYIQNLNKKLEKLIE